MPVENYQISAPDLSEKYNLYKMISESETLILTLIFFNPTAKYVAQLCFFHRE